MVDVICDVVANPNVDAFHWAFNNSAGLIHVPPARYDNDMLIKNGKQKSSIAQKWVIEEDF